MWWLAAADDDDQETTEEEERTAEGHFRSGETNISHSSSVELQTGTGRHEAEPNQWRDTVDLERKTRTRARVWR